MNKPAGLPSHPGPRGGASVEDWFPRLSRRPDGPWLAHRLDADTAGCLLIALRKSLLIAAQQAFAAGRAGKIYWAVIAGVPEAPSGLIEAPLRKISTPQGWRMVADEKGDRAASEWRVLASQEGRTLLELRPRTCRTHQLRVHCGLIGGAIIGDPVYGAPIPGERLHLLARSIDLALDPMPDDGPVCAVAPPPPHMAAALAALGYSSAP